MRMRKTVGCNLGGAQNLCRFKVQKLYHVPKVKIQERALSVSGRNIEEQWGNHKTYDIWIIRTPEAEQRTRKREHSKIITWSINNNDWEHSKINYGYKNTDPRRSKNNTKYIYKKKSTSQHIIFKLVKQTSKA